MSRTSLCHGNRILTGVFYQIWIFCVFINENELKCSHFILIVALLRNFLIVSCDMSHLPKFYISKKKRFLDGYIPSKFHYHFFGILEVTEGEGEGAEFPHGLKRFECLEYPKLSWTNF